MDLTKTNISVGDQVKVSCPGAEQDYIGYVREVFARAPHNFIYFYVTGLTSAIPGDRVTLTDTTGNPSFVALNRDRAAVIYGETYRKGFRGYITSQNHDRTIFELESNEGRPHKITIHYSDVTELVTGTCDCLYFLNRRQMCKHIALITMEQIILESSFAA
jgi:hypothetical protein